MSGDYFAAAVVPAAPPRAPRRPSTRWPAVAAGLLLAVVAAAVVTDRRSAQAVSPLRAVTEPAPAAVGWTASYVDTEGRPARWDPCTPIGYVLNPRFAPVHGRRDLAEALRRLSAASGLRFVDRGDTDELPSAERAPHQPERYGPGWAPLLVAWVPPGATDLEVGDGVQGVASATALPGTDGGHLVTAQVALDAGHRLPSGFGPGATEGEVLLHELAHAVGLGHVDDATQVMHVTTTNSESEFGRGDRAGLAALGAAAGCHPAPAP